MKMTARRAADELVLSVLQEAESLADQREYATTYFGEDLLFEKMDQKFFTSGGVKGWPLKAGFSVAAQTLRHRSPVVGRDGTRALNVLKNHIQLEAISPMYSRFKLPDGPVYIEVIRDPGGLGSRASQSGYLVTLNIAAQEPEFVATDFSVVGYGDHVGKSLERAVTVALAGNLAHMDDPYQARERLMEVTGLDLTATIPPAAGDLYAWLDLVTGNPYFQEFRQPEETHTTSGSHFRV